MKFNREGREEHEGAMALGFGLSEIYSWNSCPTWIKI
ncbi:hypothetical protein JOD20_000844 [Herpetosiphon giganteus]|nr:hypothetical protein [Herpetosiphon giganteus]